MITIKAKINLGKQDREFIKELQRQQSALTRTAYKAGLKDVKEKELRVLINEKFKGKPVYSFMDSWFIQSAIYNGLGSAKADLALGVTSRIYGGLENLSKKASGKITKAEFRERRNCPLYIIGEAPNKGNRKFKFISTEIIEFKPCKGKVVEIKLPKFRKNYQKKLEAVFEKANQKGCPITISMTSEYICFSFEDVSVEKVSKSIHSRYAGIDLNPNYVGVSIFDGTKLIASKIYSMKNLTSKNGSDNKLEFETLEVGNDIVRFLQHFQVSKVFVEDLTKLSKSKYKPKGRGFNRLVINKWKREKLLRPINRVFGKSCIQINAAYTSTIGNVLNENLPDPIAASTAIANRGYNIIIIKSKKFYPELPETRYIEDRWKKTNVPSFQDWKELHSWLKETGLKYRVDVPDTSMFRILRSKKSLVNVVDNFSYS